MVYNCEMCGKPTMVAYKSSDGLFKCLCSMCSVKYQKEMDNSRDSEIMKEFEDRINKKLQSFNKSINAIRDRLQEHEVKMGNLEKRIELLEKSNSALTAENVKKVKETIKEQMNAKKSR